MCGRFRLLLETFPLPLRRLAALAAFRRLAALAAFRRLAVTSFSFAASALLHGLRTFFVFANAKPTTAIGTDLFHASMTAEGLGSFNALSSISSARCTGFAGFAFSSLSFPSFAFSGLAALL